MINDIFYLIEIYAPCVPQVDAKKLGCISDSFALYKKSYKLIMTKVNSRQTSGKTRKSLYAKRKILLITYTWNLSKQDNLLQIYSCFFQQKILFLVSFYMAITCHFVRTQIIKCDHWFFIIDFHVYERYPFPDGCLFKNKSPTSEGQWNFSFEETIDFKTCKDYTKINLFLFPFHSSLFIRQKLIFK